MTTAIVLAAINAKWIHPSLALRILKANLGEYENRCDIMEFALRQSLPEKTAPILAAAPRILGLSVSIWNHTATIELLRALEKEWPPNGTGSGLGRPVIVLGGPEVSHLPPESEIFRHADWVVRGEGELVFRDLCALLLTEAACAGDSSFAGGGSVAEALAATPSVKRVQGKFIEPRPPDLSLIDPAYRLYSDGDLTRKLVYVEASRGCPFGCEFCLSSIESDNPQDGPQVSTRRVREFSLDSFLTAMDDLIDRGGRTFKFLDRTFNLDIDRARRIMEFFLARIEQDREKAAPQAPGSRAVPVSASGASAPRAAAVPDDAPSRPPLCVHFEMVPGRFPAELREILTRFPPGSLRLEVGIQTFNRNTASLIGRNSNPEKELEVMRFLYSKTNAMVHADLIVGLPGEDMASFGEGFDRLWMARGAEAPDSPAGAHASEIQLGILKLLPGAPIGRHTAAYGMRYSAEPPYEVLETAALPVAALDRIKNFARFWELIVNRGSFPDLVPKLFPAGEPVWGRFMELSDRLLLRFGRNWGIDRRELRGALEAE